MAVVSSALLSGVIADLYDAALEPGLWTLVLPSIASIFDSQQVAFSRVRSHHKCSAMVPDRAHRPSLRSAASPDREFSRMPYYNEVTPKEASLATSLASGMTLKEAAADTHIRINAARSYLDSIFLKTGTHQQSQLVAVLKSAQTIVHSSGH